MYSESEWERILDLRAHPKRRESKRTASAPPQIVTYQRDTNLDWQAFIQTADRYSIKALYQDRQDVSHTIVIRLAELAKQKPDHQLSQPSQCRIASYVILQYWDSLKRVMTTTSLNEEIEDGEGGTVELYQTLADDKAIDLEAWVDYRTWLKGCPRRLVQIADKMDKDIRLSHKEVVYLGRYRKKELAKRQKVLL